MVGFTRGSRYLRYCDVREGTDCERFGVRAMTGRRELRVS